VVARLRLACFGLPLAPLLLAGDGHDVRLAVLSPLAAPGRRRLRHGLGSDRILDALSSVALDRSIDKALLDEPPDLIVSWFWTRRLPARWLVRARLGGIGAHPSLLPRHRGPNPYFWPIDQGDPETGVTVHRLTERYDDGDILKQERVVIADQNSWQLARALDRPSLRLLREVVRAFATGHEPVGVAQDEASATWAPEPEGDALHLDFTWPTERLLRRVRALCPAPGAPLDVEGLKLVVLEAVATRAFPRALEPGEAAVTGDVPRLVLRTATGALAVERAALDTGDDPGEVLDGAEVARAAHEHLGSRPARADGW